MFVSRSGIPQLTMSGSNSRKSTTVSGPSGGKDYRPFLWGAYLKENELDLVYTACHYLYMGRPLMLEEVGGILGVEYKREAPSNNSLGKVFNIFNDPDWDVTKKYKARTKNKTNELSKKVEELFRTYLDKNPKAKQMAKELEGV